MKPHKFILPTIVISQLFCTSLWFAGNGVMGELITHYRLTESALGYLTSAVQIGFIIGTLIFAIFSIADRFSPSRVFFVCALLGATFNSFTIAEFNTYPSILALRFLTGFFLAGIYPVGMKIAADHFEKGLGKSLGYLVGALVLGTALPHLLKDIKGNLPWEAILITTSLLATLGGLLMISIVPNGPYRKPSQKVNFSGISSIFKNQNFSAAAFGYFGHMWELYAFWTFVPVMLLTYLEEHSEVSLNVSLLSFIIIAVGSLACVIGGYLSQKAGIKKVAFSTLLLSCICCLTFPLIFSFGSYPLFISFLVFWGMVVIADSPLFSTLVAQNAPSELKGTALTIVNSIGFFLTIISIQLINELRIFTHSASIFSILALGPILGLVSWIRKRDEKVSASTVSP